MTAIYKNLTSIFNKIHKEKIITLATWFGEECLFALEKMSFGC